MIIALHGFLGLPSDWDPVRAAMPPLKPSTPPTTTPSLKMPPPSMQTDAQASHLWQTRSLWNDLRLISSRFQSKTGTDIGSLYSPLTQLGFDFWAQQLVKELEAKIVGGAERPVILGYSLGGRLAMHAVLQRPDLFRGCVLVSANPGLPEPELGGGSLRDERFRADHLWAERFLNEPWDQVVAAWNAQPVLAQPSGAAPVLQRREKDFDRLLLGDALTIWSLARQKDLRSAFTGLHGPPTLLVTGEFDRKFTNLTAEWVKEQASLKHVVISSAGHRVPWDQPRAFASVLQNWFTQLD